MSLWLVIKKFGVPEAVAMDRINLETNPCPAIMAQGLGGVSHSQYWIEETNDSTAPQLGNQSETERNEPRR